MKCFKNAIVYVEGEGLKKCTLSFEERIIKIGKKEIKNARIKARLILQKEIEKERSNEISQ